MAKSASEGIQELIDRTAGPRIESKVTVDQPYAQDQHETMYYRHPRGGRAKYLEGPLFESYNKWLQEFADGLLRRGADAEHGWADVGRSLKGEVFENAPMEFGDLRRSAGLEVKVGGRVAVNEPPAQERLTDAELDAKDHMRHMNVGYRE